LKIVAILVTGKNLCITFDKSVLGYFFNKIIWSHWLDPVCQTKGKLECTKNKWVLGGNEKMSNQRNQKVREERRSPGANPSYDHCIYNHNAGAVVG
jgi:hypothetical protein